MIPDVHRHGVGASGQSMLETAFILVTVMAALFIMFGFIRNAVSSRLKEGADTFGHGLQFECDNRWLWEPCEQGGEAPPPPPPPGAVDRNPV